MARFSKLMTAGGLLLAATTLGGCVYDDYGYGGVSVGYGVGGGYPGPYYDNGYGYDGYGYGGYGAPGYAYGYGSGWYGDFFYPGTGFYVYDRGGRRSRWNDDQRRYWETRRQNNVHGGVPGDGRPGYRPEYRRDGVPGDGRPGYRPDYRRDGGADRQGNPGYQGYRGRDGQPGQQVPGTVQPGQPDGRLYHRDYRGGGDRGRPQYQGSAPGVTGQSLPAPRPERVNGGDGGRRGGQGGGREGRAERSHEQPQ